MNENCVRIWSRQLKNVDRLCLSRGFQFMVRQSLVWKPETIIFRPSRQSRVWIELRLDLKLRNFTLSTFKIEILAEHVDPGFAEI